jgi:hypothetical protein
MQVQTCLSGFLIAGLVRYSLMLALQRDSQSRCLEDGKAAIIYQ